MDARFPFTTRIPEKVPADAKQRDAVLLAVMGSPDVRQIDGIGGADPLTSKVAIIQRSMRPDADVDYLFAQVNVDRAVVDYGQNCGNILAAVGPFAIERGLVPLTAPVTQVRVHMVNTGQIAVAEVRCMVSTTTRARENSSRGRPTTSKSFEAVIRWFSLMLSLPL